MLVTFSISSMAFMSGIDPSRDTQGELDIIGATIPLAPANASVNAGYVKFTNTSDKDVEFHRFTSPVYDSVEMHVTENKSGSANLPRGATLAKTMRRSICRRILIPVCYGSCCALFVCLRISWLDRLPFNGQCWLIHAL